MSISFRTAYTNVEFEHGKVLFLEYADSLNIDLSFQDFAKELETIYQLYKPPKGSLLLAYHNDKAIACVGIRELEKGTAELKRMYVQTAYRGRQVGKKLLELSLDTAKDLGYDKIRLDTLPDMMQAQNLYRRFHFYEIPSYRFNPIEGTVYMEKSLL